MTYSAWTILNDPKRPSSVLALYEPPKASRRAKAKKYAFLDEIRYFHLEGRTRFTRFKRDYGDLCSRLSRLIGSLDFAMPQVCVVLGKEMDLMVRDWSSTDSAVWAADMHSVWVELHHLRLDLDKAREPLIQKLYISELPKSVLRAIVGLLGPEDARNLAEMSKTFRDECSTTLDRYGKVSLRPSHVTLDKHVLSKCRHEIAAPRTTFGRGLAVVWAWFRDRASTGRSSKTIDLHLVNQWSWAWNAYAEFKWVAMPRELAAWSTAFSCGVSSLRHLRDLRLDGLALTIDAILAISEHPTLRGLHAHGCGIPLEHEKPVLPPLKQIRRLVVSCDPASVFETGSGVRLIGLAPNVVRLRVESRLRDGPLPLELSQIWKGAPLRAVQDITLRDVDARSAATVLGGCLSRRVERFRVRFHVTAMQTDVDSILARLLHCTSVLVCLVLDGIPPPTVTWVSECTTAFSGLSELGILCRPDGHSVTSCLSWNVSFAAFADALRAADRLERLCTNIARAVDAIAPEHAHGEGHADRSSALQAPCPTPGDEGGVVGAALLLGNRLKYLEEVVFAGHAASRVAIVGRTSRGTVVDFVTVEPAIGSTTDPWWCL